MWAPACFLAGIADHLGFLLLNFSCVCWAYLSKKVEIRAPASSNSAWHFWPLLSLQTSLNCLGEKYDNCKAETQGVIFLRCIFDSTHAFWCWLDGTGQSLALRHSLYLRGFGSRISKMKCHQEFNFLTRFSWGISYVLWFQSKSHILTVNAVIWIGLDGISMFACSFAVFFRLLDGLFAELASPELPLAE